MSTLAAATARSVEVRTARAALRAEVRSVSGLERAVMVGRILRDPPPEVAGARLSVVVGWAFAGYRQAHWVEDVLARAGIRQHDKPVGQLTRAQATRVASALARTPYRGTRPNGKQKGASH